MECSELIVLLAIKRYLLMTLGRSLVVIPFPFFSPFSHKTFQDARRYVSKEGGTIINIRIMDCSKSSYNILTI